MKAAPWMELFPTFLDAMGFVLYLVVFPVYHGLYPALARARPHGTAKGRMDQIRDSWIRGLLDRRDFAVAAQQTRNLTMANSLLGSAALILMGMTANLLVRLPAAADFPHPSMWDDHPGATTAKLYLLIAVFALAFSYCMGALRRLGHFNMVIGAERSVVDGEEGSAEEYLIYLINRASNRHTLAVRTLFATFPLFAWLFDTWLFIALTLFFGMKFVVVQDFRRAVRRGDRSA